MLSAEDPAAPQPPIAASAPATPFVDARAARLAQLLDPPEWARAAQQQQQQSQQQQHHQPPPHAARYDSLSLPASPSLGLAPPSLKPPGRRYPRASPPSLHHDDAADAWYSRHYCATAPTSPTAAAPSPPSPALAHVVEETDEEVQLAMRVAREEHHLQIEREIRERERERDREILRERERVRDREARMLADAMESLALRAATQQQHPSASSQAATTRDPSPQHHFHPQSPAMSQPQQQSYQHSPQQPYHTQQQQQQQNMHSSSFPRSDSGYFVDAAGMPYPADKRYDHLYMMPPPPTPGPLYDPHAYMDPRTAADALYGPAGSGAQGPIAGPPPPGPANPGLVVEMNTAAKHIYVSDLPAVVDEMALRKAFRRFGRIDDIRLSKSKLTGTLNGVAYIKFTYAESVAKALDADGQIYVGSKRIKVAPTDPTENPTKKLFFANVWDMTEHDLVPICQRFGDVVQVDVVADRGMMYVHFARLEDSVRAHLALQGLTINNRYVRVEFGQSAANYEHNQPGGHHHPHHYGGSPHHPHPSMAGPYGSGGVPSMMPGYGPRGAGGRYPHQTGYYPPPLSRRHHPHPASPYPAAPPPMPYSPYMDEAHHTHPAARRPSSGGPPPPPPRSWYDELSSMPPASGTAARPDEAYHHMMPPLDMHHPIPHYAPSPTAAPAAGPAPTTEFMYAPPGGGAPFMMPALASAPAPPAPHALPASAPHPNPYAAPQSPAVSVPAAGSLPGSGAATAQTSPAVDPATKSVSTPQASPAKNPTTDANGNGAAPAAVNEVPAAPAAAV